MKLEITRQELEQIHSIACADWKPKLTKYATETPFSATIKFTEKQVSEMIKASTANQLPTVSKIFDIQDITQRLQTFEKVLEYLGEEDTEVIEYRKLVKADITSKPLYFQMGICIVRAYNEKHELDWSDSDEYKYYIWWYMNSFRLCSVSGRSENSFTPSALCFKHSNLAKSVSENKEFIVIFKKFML